MKQQKLLVAGLFVCLLGVGACCDKPTCENLDRWAREMAQEDPPGWEAQVVENIDYLRSEVKALRDAGLAICAAQAIDPCPFDADPTVPGPPKPPPEYP